jgi:hypothetical protein
MVKNESLRLEHWLKHLETFADLVVLINHFSTDNSLDLIRSSSLATTNRVKVIEALNPAYYQREMMNELCTIVSSALNECWLFPMDADEYLLYPVPSMIRTLIQLQKRSGALSFAWKNAAPLSIGSSFAFDRNEYLEVSRTPSPYRKVAFSSGLVKRGFRLTQGNHELEHQSREKQLDLPLAGYYLHLPIISETQFLQKLHAGVRSYLTTGKIYQGQGIHWLEYLIDVHKGRLDARSYALNYPDCEPKGKINSGYLMRLDDLES